MHSMEWFSVDMGALDDLFEGLPTTLSVSEAAKVFNVSEHIIRAAIGSADPEEKLPALNLGRGYTILTADFKKWALRRYTGHSDD
ncbi:helix-turn-helix domain-containing protein [Leifsonia sp. P73]|uniref:helix-turn-helix domain-containing protein n=2 Tax=Leifsonia TaxID=110932 RepID=UPI003DA24D97